MFYLTKHWPQEHGAGKKARVATHLICPAELVPDRKTEIEPRSPTATPEAVPTVSGRGPGK